MAVGFGWSYEVSYLLSHHEEYLRGIWPVPVTDGEAELARHRYGAELALALAAPARAEPTSIASWIAWRAAALAALLANICAEKAAHFTAIIEPSSFADLCPSYIATLRSAYAAAATEIGFEVWCREHGYCSDPAAWYEQNIRPLWDHL